MNKEQSLLNCPFCGGEARIEHAYPLGKPVPYVACSECGAARHTADDWNRRPQLERQLAAPLPTKLTMQECADALPEGVSWYDPITPEMVRAILAQRAAPPVQGSVKDGFEAWAKSHGGVDIESAEPYEYRADNGWFPATYRCNRTELAWRAWANKPAAAPQAPQQEPVAWIRCHPDGNLTNEILRDGVIEQVRKTSGAWRPLYAAPISEAKETE